MIGAVTADCPTATHAEAEVHVTASRKSKMLALGLAVTDHVNQTQDSRPSPSRSFSRVLSDDGNQGSRLHVGGGCHRESKAGGCIVARAAADSASDSWKLLGFGGSMMRPRLAPALGQWRSWIGLQRSRTPSVSSGFRS